MLLLEADAGAGVGGVEESASEFLSWSSARFSSP